MVIESARDSCMFGIHFRPGGLHPFVRLPVSELNETVVNLEQIWGGFAGEVREKMLGTQSPGGRLDILEQALLHCAADRLEFDRTLAYALGRITALPEEVRIHSLAAEIGLSHRQLIRKFDEKVGLKPKGLARVFRFNRVLKTVNANSGHDWAAIASDFGYFDQAHLCHEFQELAGMTPTQYLEDRADYTNFVPISIPW